MKKVILIILALSVAFSCAIGFAACSDKDDPNVITIRNLYFGDWNGEDDFTPALEEMIGKKIKVSSYSWADWNTQVNSAYNSGTLPNVFNRDVDSYNYANTYLRYQKGGTVRALPEDLTPWPNLKAVIDSIEDIEQFKIDGKLYGIPVKKNISGNAVDFAPFTYVYRRDWALDLQKEGKLKLNGQNIEVDDEYTWKEFEAIIEAFYYNKYLTSDGKISPIADVEWGFPSIINFYKNAPHCFVYDAEGKVVSNYATDEYLEGLNLTKEWVNKKYYAYDQSNSSDGSANRAYYSGRIGIFYENLSLTNYVNLRKMFKKVGDPAANKKTLTQQEIDDRTAIMKVAGPTGEYSLEGAEDWFSMTFISSKVSDEKMEAILKLMDYLLSEEGTLYSLYGEKNVDYRMVDITDESVKGVDYDYVWRDGRGIKLTNKWIKVAGSSGEYAPRYNGAYYLRYICTLGYDVIDINPSIDTAAYNILREWETFMQDQNEKGNLRILKEPAEVKWMSTPTKKDRSSALLDGANTSVIQYAYNKIKTEEAYVKKVTTGYWTTVLQEINEALGKN